MMSDVYGKRVKRKSRADYEEPVVNRHVSAKREPSDAYYRSLAEKIAHHRLYERNKIVWCLKESFPFTPSLWHADRYFPYADGGPLYIDEPQMDPDIKDSEKKQEVARKNGIRFLILKPGTGWQDAMSELAQIECPGQPELQN